LRVCAGGMLICTASGEILGATTYLLEIERQPLQPA
jgi:hypothetical protein